MKKALSFAVALGLVAGAASVASAAELIMTGDARMRGVYHNNYSDGDDNVADKDQHIDHRYRLKLDTKVNDNVTVQARVVLGDTDFAGDEATGFTADRYNMVIKTLGGTWTLGRQEASWGNAALPYTAKDVTKDRIKGVYKVGDVTLGAYLQKDSEANVAGVPVSTDAKMGDGDTDSWGALVIAKAGDANFGLLSWYTKVDTAAAKASGIKSGYVLDPFFNAKIGSTTLMGEARYEGGKLNKHMDKAKIGGFLKAVVGMDPVTVVGLLAYSQNNSVATDKFAPSVLVGTTNSTGVFNFGQLQNTTVNNDRSYLVGGKVDFKASDKLSFGATVAYVGISKTQGVGGTKSSVTEYDVTMEYALAQNAKYKFGIGYGDPKNIYATNDNMLAIGNSVEVAW